MIELIEDAGELSCHPLVLARMRGLPADRVARLLGEERMIRLRAGEDVAVFEDRTLGQYYGIVFDIDQGSSFTWDALEYMFSTVGAADLIFDSVGEAAGYQYGGYHAGILLSQATPARWHWRLERKAFWKANEERRIDVEAFPRAAEAGADGGPDYRNAAADEIAGGEGRSAAVAGGRRKQRAPRPEHRL